MHSLKELEKQPVDLRLHSYLVEELDEMTEAFSINRNDIIVEAIKAYISEHKALMICQELEQVVADGGSKDLQSLDNLISDLESN